MINVSMVAKSGAAACLLALIVVSPKSGRTPSAMAPPSECSIMLKGYEEFLPVMMNTLDAKGFVSHDSSTVILMHAKLSHDLSQKCGEWFRKIPPASQRERDLFDEARRVDAFTSFNKRSRK
ncbi:MAG: hypothetical protein JWN89_219 [Parcubacteria group bacterium]|nr:hypothetical protein [Parcubacteria group bacterium]